VPPRKPRRKSKGKAAAAKPNKAKAATPSRFKVYRPAVVDPVASRKGGNRPAVSRFSVHRGSPSRKYVDVDFTAAEPNEPPPSRFSVYRPKPPEVERWKPTGAAWIEHDGYWLCVYRCKTFKVREAPKGVDDDDYHAWDCPYWFNEGIDQTPF
jgi:hypothetical protein